MNLRPVKNTHQHPLLAAQRHKYTDANQTLDIAALLESVSDTYHRLDRELADLTQTNTPNQLHLECSQAINQRLNGSEDTVETLKYICQCAAQVFAASRVGVWIFKDTLYQPFFEMEYDLLHAHFSPVRFQSCGLDQAYLDELKSQQCLPLNDIANTPVLNPNSRLYLNEHKLASLIDIPINTGTGYFGLLRIAQIAPGRHWSLEEQQFATHLADKISLVAYRHYSQHERQNDESESRFKSLAQSSDAAIFAFRNFIFFSNSAMEKLTGFGEDALRVLPVGVLLGEYFAGQFNSQVLKNTDPGTKRRLEIEFTNRSGDTRWALISVTASNFENRPTWLATAIDITDRKRSEVQLNRQAFHDSLTGLPNRAKLLTEIDRCLVKANRDRNFKFALIFLDLDGFKQINDNLGHLFADELLVEIAMRLRELAEIQHTAARLGGDEFAFLLTDVTNTDQATAFASKILQEIQRPVINDEQGVHISASLGICLGDRFSDSAEIMLRQADVAMYQAKEQGRNRFAVFDRDVHAQLQQTLSVEKQWRDRLRIGDFQINFSPIIDTATGVLAQFDCAIKGQTEKNSPLVDFTQPTSDSTLAMAIEDWVIQKCVQHHGFFNHPCLQLNLSISAKSLTDPQFIRRLGQQLAIIPAGGIAVTVLESDWVFLHERFPKNVRMMQELPVHWIMDDFGSGQSCLRYISSLPIKTIKIDARFIHAMTHSGGQHPVKAIVEMGKSMGVQIVAKGVNTLQHLDWVRRLNCPLAQGDLITSVDDINSALRMLDKPLLHF